MREHGRGKRWLLLRRWESVRGSKRAELQALFAANRRLFKAYVLREQLDRLWTYRTRPGVLNFLMAWFKALRWQRLPEMEQLGDFLLKHINGIAAYCDHPVRFSVVESINTTIKAVLRRELATYLTNFVPVARWAVSHSLGRLHDAEVRAAVRVEHTDRSRSSGPCRVRGGRITNGPVADAADRLHDSDPG